MSTIDRIYGSTGSVAVKAPCAAATTANIVLSGLQTIDGVALAAGDRVLVKDQSTGSQNGIWVVATGAWTRAADFNGALDVVQGSMVFVIGGTANGGAFWRLDTASPVVGTSSLSFIRTMDSASALFTQAGAGAVSRSVQAKLQETVSLTDFGGDPTGTADSATAFQAVLNRPASGKTIYCHVPDGTWKISTALSAGSGKVIWLWGRNVTLTGTQTASLPFVPSKTMLNGSPVGPAVPVTTLVDGTASVPLTTLDYTTPTIYLERHSNTTAASSCDWGNAKKQAPLEIEVLVYGSDTSEANGISSRVFSSTARPGGAPTSDAILVGGSFLAQSNAPNGTANRDVFGLNVVVASSSGNGQTNIVGIETDVIPNPAGASSARPGAVGATNYTAYWAQAAGGDTPCNTAFYASSTGTGGWQDAIVIDTYVNQYLAYLRTAVNTSAAKGIRVETQYQSSTGRVLELFAATNEQLRVDGASDNPVWVRVNSTLKQVVVGAADSGGTGYRVLRVTN